MEGHRSEPEHDLCAGQIILNAKRVYYVPHDPAVPPLQFKPELQAFVALDNRKREDFATATTLRDMTRHTYSASSPQRVTTRHYSTACDEGKRQSRRRGDGRTRMDGVSIDENIPCEALYGVLPINKNTSVLLYVTEKVLVDEVAACSLVDKGGRHRIYAVRKLEWMRLPSAFLGGADDNDGDGTDADDEEASQRRRASGSKEGGGNGEDADGSSPSSPEKWRNDRSEKAVNLSNSDSGKTEQTIAEYLEVVDRFCQRVEKENSSYPIPHYLREPASNTGVAPRERGGFTTGGSFLFYCPTLNLALDSASLIRQAAVGTDGAVRAGSDADELPDRLCPPYLELDEQYEDLFSWNHHLVLNFKVPTVKDVLTTLSEEGEAGAAKAAELQKRVRSFSDANSTSLFVPSFIRGYVGGAPIGLGERPPAAGAAALHMLFLSRLCRRWSGTRYNRRGVEPNESGVVANMCLTTVLLFDKQTNRIAAFDIIRGSVPRRWEQPANLSFKPTIKIHHPYTSACDHAGGGRKSGDAGAASSESLNDGNPSTSAGGSATSGSDSHHPDLRGPTMPGSTTSVSSSNSSSNYCSGHSSNAMAAAQELCQHFRLLKGLFPHIEHCVIVDTLSTSKLEKPLADNFLRCLRPSARKGVRGGRV
ncbi:synaptojanin [Strigomonas culicis]|uniref:Synaptojanin n=1 Tax=Strigomonas culicis TaxID=28005 RepID=S9UYQ5_9TRYP|nr:synaptojanin [Strigomonas culicis]|eukprot:EPY15650.1 synaptojanin [Strigomonas culicis]